MFDYTVDHRQLDAALWDPMSRPRTRRHHSVIGNRRLSVVVDNDGLCGVWDEIDGLRWITAPDPDGTGRTVVKGNSSTWGTASNDWPDGVTPVRQFGPTWFTVRAEHDGLRITREVLCPEGEQPWVLIRVTLEAIDGIERTIDLTEEWSLRPRFVNLFSSDEERRLTAERVVSYELETQGGRVDAVETRSDRVEEGPIPYVFGTPHRVVLEAIGRPVAAASHHGAPHPTLRVSQACTVPAVGPTERWFRFGLDDGTSVQHPERLRAESRERLAARLPRGTNQRFPREAAEVAWHAALLTGGACVDGRLGGHTLDQASTYSFDLGFNGAARDPLQHALPLIYIDPELALSAFQNTCSWAAPTGELPYALDGAKRPRTEVFRPSDQNLWALWFGAEYLAATGDEAAFERPINFHPHHDVGPVALFENLSRQFRWFVDGVGTGSHGHVRMMNADWNDMAVLESGVPPEVMVELGESVLNSAMAATVLPVWAGACRRLGDAEQAAEAGELAEILRKRVADEWNGRWVRRAYGPGVPPIGDDDLWLEVQPWAILSGALSQAQTTTLLSEIDELLRVGSPIGARSKWPVAAREGAPNVKGEGHLGGMWFAISMTLAWAAARVDPELAWDEWRRMSLTAHTDSYPDVWEGTLSGPDSYNSAESARPGRTWGIPDSPFAMQSFPVFNLHSHAQPLLTYLRLLGVEPTPEGTLRIGAGGAGFDSQVLHIEPGAGGRIVTKGPVTLETASGTVTGGPGEVRW